MPKMNKNNYRYLAQVTIPYFTLFKRPASELNFLTYQVFIGGYGTAIVETDRCRGLNRYRRTGTDNPFQLPIDGAATVDFDDQCPCLYQACILMIGRCGLSRTAGCNVVLVCC